MNLYHYCPNSSFVSIIANKTLHLSEFTLSNDVLEGRWIKQVFADYGMQKKVSALDIEGIKGHLDTMLSYAGAAGFCMSEADDMLSQWRGYANDGAGVSIGFSSKYFDALKDLRVKRNDEFGVVLRKVEYDASKQQRTISEQADLIFECVSDGALHPPTLLSSDDSKARYQKRFPEMLDHIFQLMPYLYAMKNPAFAEEREWRLISHLFFSSGGVVPNDLNRMDFRALVDRIVPYRAVKLEQLENEQPIVSVTLGPKNLTPVSIAKGVLEKHGWPQVEVRKSKASYR